jgi:hypothetical protein
MNLEFYPRTVTSKKFTCKINSSQKLNKRTKIILKDAQNYKCIPKEGRFSVLLKHIVFEWFFKV